MILLKRTVFLSYNRFTTIIFIEFEDNMNVLYMPVNTDNFSSIEEQLLSYVSESRREKIISNTQDKVKLLSLYSALLLRFGLFKYYGISQELIFDKTNDGKPFITNLNNFDFNISHTKNMVMCGINNNGKIGVDVEHIRSVHKNVEKKVYSLEEISYIHESVEDSSFRFFEIWTKKEAYTKYIGTGLRNDINNINMLSDIHNDKLLFWNNDNYFYSVYSDSLDNKPVEVSIEDIINHFL